MTYREHPKSGMIKIDSCNVNFLKDEFPSMGEIKKDLEPYELQQDLQPSLDKGENLNACQVIKNGEPPLPKRNGRDLSTQGNEVCPQSPTPEENPPEKAKSPRA